MCSLLDGHPRYFVPAIIMKCICGRLILMVQKKFHVEVNVYDRYSVSCTSIGNLVLSRTFPSVGNFMYCPVLLKLIYHSKAHYHTQVFVGQFGSQISIAYIIQCLFQL